MDRSLKNIVETNWKLVNKLTTNLSNMFWTEKKGGDGTSALDDLTNSVRHS